MAASSPPSPAFPKGGWRAPALQIYLHLFDEKMLGAGFALTRWADDWVIVCRSKSEAKRALTSARAVLEGDLKLTLNREKTRIVHITQGFAFLGFWIRKGPARPATARVAAMGPGLFVVPTRRSIQRFEDKVRAITGRRNGRSLRAVLDELNPVIQGWGTFYKHADVRGRFNGSTSGSCGGSGTTASSGGTTPAGGRTVWAVRKGGRRQRTARSAASPDPARPGAESRRCL